MTKFDIRIRRKQFRQGSIDRHKDFRNLMGNYDKSSRKRTRGFMVLVFLLIIILAVLLAFFNSNDEKMQESPKNQEQSITSLERTNDIENKTVYKL